MQTSSHSLPAATEKALLNQLFTLLADLKHPQDVEKFLSNFLTTTEKLVFAKRLAIATELARGTSYEDIKAKLKVSSATISSVAEQRDQAGWQLALQKINDDQWAENILKRFSLRR